MEALTKYLAVAGGGAAGAVLRYYMTGSALARAAAPFPTATFVINVTGSFVIGFFLTLAGERAYVNPHVRLAVAVGFVGAYTTFSTFEYETARYLGIGISNLIIGFSPQIVVVGGAITRAWDLVSDRFSETVKRSIRRGLPSARITRSTIGDRASLMGALSLVLANKFASVEAL